MRRAQRVRRSIESMAVAPNGSFLGGCGSTGESAAGGRRALPADRFPHQYSSQRVAATLLSYRRLRYHATPAPPLLRARLCVSWLPARQRLATV